jgi:hypothetical protein
MKKELVTIEFRYNKKPKGEWDTEYPSKMVTIGVFDTLEEAIIEGNKALEKLENRFKLHVFPSLKVASKERFSKNGGCFGSAKKLITDMAYLRTPFSFFAKIETLHFFDVEETINEVLQNVEEYKEYKKNLIEY